jgi:hypothetical protein
MRPYLQKKPITKIGLVEWLKGEALSSKSSVAKKKKKEADSTKSRMRSTRRSLEMSTSLMLAKGTHTHLSRTIAHSPLSPPQALVQLSGNKGC